ncbi:hypothetical protein P43SY_005166 [Pythium insidiosum]|uniref:ZZ-type domain-containing protein n=1 Tax=Pythium insidiosum TaxID=114742 RepID=A0AAD5LLT9_PYTIN|nr:hypothetical protein P43SY_005166 [Pythium insidiosum]
MPPTTTENPASASSAHVSPDKPPALVMGSPDDTEVDEDLPSGDELGTPLGAAGSAFDFDDEAYSSHRFIGPSVTGEDNSARALHGIRRVDVHAKPPRFVSDVASQSILPTERRSSSEMSEHSSSMTPTRSLSTDQQLGLFRVTFSEEVLGFTTQIGIIAGDVLISVNGHAVEAHTTTEELQHLLDSQPMPRTIIFSRPTHEQPAEQVHPKPTGRALPFGGKLSSALSYGSSLLPVKLKRKKSVVHKNTSCEGCGMSPIAGALWTCSVCSNYNLCGECYDAGTHGMENTDAMQALNEAIVQEKLVKKCKRLTAEFLLSLRRDICKGRPDKFEYMGNWIADIVSGTAASKITVRGIEVPHLPPAARQRFVSNLMPLVSNRTDIEVNIEWLPDDTDRSSVEVGDTSELEAGEELEKLRIWISDKKSRTANPFTGAASSGVAIRATGASFGGIHHFSTEAEATQDATSAFLEATEGDDVRTVKTMKMNIRYSPRKLTYLAQQIRGLPANEALLQMKFSPKRKAEIVRKTVQNAVNLADIKYQIEPENLQVAECFVNKGHYLKRLRIMGRGRSGIMHHPHSHLTVVLREFDPSKKPLNRFMTKKLARESASKASPEQASE